MFAACDQSSIALAQSDLGFPTDVLNGFGLGFESELQMPADLGWIAGCPGAFAQGASGMGVAGFGNGSLSASLTRGILRRNQAQELHELSGVIAAGEVAQFRHRGHRHRELHAAQRLKRLDDRGQPPGFDLLLEFLFEPLEAFGGFGDRPDICWENDGLRRGGTDHFREPSEMGRAPCGPARITDVVSEQDGFEAELGVFEIADGICTRPAEVANRFVFHRGDIDRGKITRARQAGQLHGVPAVGFDAVAGLLRDQGGGDDPAVIAFFGEIPVEPVATRAGFVDEDEVFGFRLHLADQLIDVTLTRADGPKIHDLGAMSLSHVSHSD
jgi:hypothetical protein